MNRPATPSKNLVKILIALTIVIVSSQSLIGRNYYFSNSIGNDLRTSTQAQNSATPWKSISKLNSFFVSLVAGDSVLFKRGESFYGSIVVAKSGTSSLPIVIGAYGSGTMPVITAFQSVAGWTNVGNNIWESSVTNSKSTLNMVTVNGVNTPMGRYPNTGYLEYESFNSYISITDNELTNSPNWKGAEVVIKKREWIIDRCLISNHTNNTITYTNSSSNPGKAGWGYFIQNDPKTLNATGEWFLNKTTKKLQMYFSGNNPNSYIVKASTLDTVVYCYNRNYITFTSLNFEGGNLYGFYLYAGSNVKILDCGINKIGGTAVYYPGSNYLTVDGCNISNINDNVINGGASTSTNAYVGHNTIKNTGIIPGNAGVGDGHNFGISIQGDNSIAEYNSIVNSGYLAIILSGNNTIARYNSIDSACLIKNDGGAIYISGSLPTIMSNRIIEHNVISNVIGCSEGNAGTAPSARGIYVDGYGNNVIIRNNTVLNCADGGINLSFYTHNISVLNNTLYNNKYNISFIEGDILANNYIIKGNILASSGKTTDLMRTVNTGTYSPSISPYVFRPAEGMGTWDGNYYIKPFDDKGIFRHQYITPKLVYDCFTVNGWSKYDVNMKFAPTVIIPYKINSLIGNNKVPNGTYTNNTSGTTITYYGTSQLTVDNTNKISGGSAKISYSTPLSTQWSYLFIKIPVGAVAAGKKYILKFDILGTKPDRAIAVRLARPFSNEALTPDNKYYPFTNAGTTTNEILFEPTASEPNANIYMVLRDEDNTVYFDNVSLYEANVTVANPEDLLRFEYNSTNSPQTTTLDGTYLDVNRAVYSSSLTLDPYSSVLLFKSANTSTNRNPIILNQSFLLDENKPNNTVVGTIGATDPDAAQTKTFSIASGNTNGAFTINTSTGALTVANTTALNFEITPKFFLLVKVQDNGIPTLSSQASTTVTIKDINEKPSISNQTYTANANAANGTVVGTVLSNDPDAGQTLTYSIISGNTNNAFSINATTGVLTVASSSSLNYQTTPTFILIIKVQDNGVVNLSNQANITINLLNSTICSATGNITYQVWNNIVSPTSISSLTSDLRYPSNPSSTTLITSMEGMLNQADAYGARIAGYICAPATGSYTFWIASDNYSELWLSTNDQSVNKQKIAYNNSATTYKGWNTYTTQKSVQINLIQGKKYYIEALMVEAFGGDNLAVGWLKPGQTDSEPSEVIPGSVLSPIESSLILVTSVSLPATYSVNTSSSALLLATVLPNNSTNNTLNWTSSNPAIVSVNNIGLVTGITAGNATITAKATDGSNKSDICLVTVNEPPCSAIGNITYQVWNNISSPTSVSSLTNDINYPSNPSSTSLITSMEGMLNQADEYGARIAGYICAPATGSYTFWIASDNYGELWLSTNDQSVDKQKIAYNNSATSYKDWNTYTTQKSVQINLIQGKKYYIEAIMVEAFGGDNLAVGWLRPGQTGTIPSEVVPGSVLSPLGIKSKEATISITKQVELALKLEVYPNPLNNDVLNIKIENLVSEAEVKIFSITGVECFTKLVQNSGTLQIDRSVFKSGVYIIKLINNSFITTTKLIVK